MCRAPQGAQHLEVSTNNDEGPPVPIPNTEVKLISGDNTWLATAREDSTAPTQRSSCENAAASFIQIGPASLYAHVPARGPRARNAGFRFEKDCIAAAHLRRNGPHRLRFPGLRKSRENSLVFGHFSFSNRSGRFGLKKDEGSESRSSEAANHFEPEDASAIEVFWGRNESRPKMIPFHSHLRVRTLPSASVLLNKTWPALRRASPPGRR